MSELPAALLFRFLKNTLNDLSFCSSGSQFFFYEQNARQYMTKVNKWHNILHSEITY